MKWKTNSDTFACTTGRSVSHACSDTHASPEKSNREHFILHSPALPSQKNHGFLCMHCDHEEEPKHTYLRSKSEGITRHRISYIIGGLHWMLTITSPYDRSESDTRFYWSPQTPLPCTCRRIWMYALLGQHNLPSISHRSSQRFECHSQNTHSSSWWTMARNKGCHDQ